MDPAEAKQHLAGERDRLAGIRQDLLDDGVTVETEEASLSELSSNAQHQADLGTETFERERDLSILEQIEGELDGVDEALRRIEAGTYGICEACGRPIEDARLAVLPAARFCVGDQEQAESELRGSPGAV
ncbi:MAG: TraR/DksA C4-type zinc finger protein [Actinomycetota bacterium]|nr:TraR/DksA C4-type zinc finger protein [Actinomycetota bacterium]